LYDLVPRIASFKPMSQDGTNYLVTDRYELCMKLQQCTNW